MLTSPFAQLHQALIARITEKMPAIRYIEQDLGQLENYELRPAVSWPCVLIDMGDTAYSHLGELVQQATANITLRLALVKYTDSNNLVPANIRENALQYYELEQQLVAALHGWAPDIIEGPAEGEPLCQPLMRSRAATEQRDDDIRVRIIGFATAFFDEVAMPATLTAAPALSITQLLP